MKGAIVVFNIGSQHEAINNVTGSQTTHGGQRVSFTDAAAIVSAGELARALRGLGLGESARDVDEIERELKQGTPDREHVASRLTHIAQTVTAIAGAGSAVHRPLVALAGWLGAPGSPVLHALGL